MNQTRVLSVSAWAAENRLVNVVPELRYSQLNGYAFITFIRPNAEGKNDAINLYLSKGAAEAAKGVVLDENSIQGFLDKHNVTLYVTPEGEERQKLSRKDGGNWVKLSDLWG